MSSVDRYLGQVLDTLEKTGQTDNTIVVFTSDHGERMGSHGLMGKGGPEDESFLVPCLIRYPSVIKPRADSLLLETVDFMPSMLGLMGLADRIPDTAEGRDFSGGIATGDYSSCPKRASALFWTRKAKGIRTDRYTYVVDPDGAIEVMDNVSDPYQLKRLRPDEIPPADLAMLKAELGRRLTDARDRWAEEGKFAHVITY